MKLKISDSLSLPIEAVTQTFGVLAVKGAGKSYTASVIAEEMLKNLQQIVVIDITGAWYGLKSSADGRNIGFPIAIFGGDHADVPLEETAGEIIATAIVDKKFSAILDLSNMRKGQMLRFLAPFFETLYRLNRSPIHLFADEADSYVPQKVFGEQARTVGAMEDIVRRGRKKGIGCSMITQRPASLNKDVLTQCEVLIALRMSHPRDIDAIKEWVNVHSSVSDAKDLIDSLPSMQVGNAWVWSPSWLKVFKKIQIRLRETFDSGATPKPGEVVKVPKKLAAIDIEKLGREINETVEKKKAEDPKELKKKITDLQQQIKNLEKLPPKKEVQKRVDVPVLKDSQIKLLDNIYTRIINEADRHGKAMALFWDNMDEVNKAMLAAFKSVSDAKGNFKSPLHPAITQRMNEHKVARITKEIADRDGIGISKCERAILQVLATRHQIDTTKSQIGILSGYSSTSGSFNNSLSSLRTKGMINSGEPIKITEVGFAAVGNYEEMPTGKALHQYWYNKLGKAESTILKVLIDSGGMTFDKQVLGEHSGYAHTSGSFNNSLSKLRTLQLIEGSKEIKAADIFFE